MFPDRNNLGTTNRRMSSFPTTIEEWIRSENSHQPSCEDQILTAYWFFNQDIADSREENARTSAVEEKIGHRLGYQVRGILDNLEELGVLEQVPRPGSGRYIRNHRTEQNFYDPASREFVPLLDKEISRFIEDMQNQEQEQPLPTPDGGDSEEEEPPETLRTVAASALDVNLPMVKDKLTGPADPVERMNRYDTALSAVKRNDDVSRNGDYDEMGWRNMAIRWTLTERAVRIEENESIT